MRETDAQFLARVRIMPATMNYIASNQAYWDALRFQQIEKADRSRRFAAILRGDKVRPSA